MNQISSQYTSPISNHRPFNQTFSRVRQASEVISPKPRVLKDEGSTSVLKQRMAVVNLEAAVGTQNSNTLKSVTQLGLAYRFNKAAAVRLSPSLHVDSPFGMAAHFMR